MGLFAGWLAAGSLGVLSEPLQATLTGLLLAAAAICVRPNVTRRGLLAACGILFAVWLMAVVVAPVRYILPLTVVVVMSLLASGLIGVARRLMLCGALAVLTLVLYRLAQQALPGVWLLSDAVGGLLGRLIGALLGRPVVIGASFAGLDFLVVGLVFGIGWLTLVRRPRAGAILFAVISMTAAHGVYLVVLGFLPEIIRALPPVEVPAMGDPYVPPPFSWPAILRQVVPWNLPVVAALLHTLLVVVLIQTGFYRPGGPGDEESRVVHEPRRRWIVSVSMLCVFAAALPLAAVARTARPLDGKRIVANRDGQLDWAVPQHDQYGRDTAGMYGMLPMLVASLGGELDVSAELSAAELESADALLLLHPDRSLSLEQQERVWKYVRDGGSLLVVTEGFYPGDGLERRVDQLLEPTAISVHRDAAVSQTQDWWGSLRTFEHRATRSAFPEAARPWSDSGASLGIRWPAQPLTVGVWGWSAPEQGAVWTDRQNLVPGAKLGDLVLAAEQRVGGGRVVVWGDNSSLTNEGIVAGHERVADLLSYLASPVSRWRDLARLLVIGLCLAGLLGLLSWRPGVAELAGSCVVLAGFLAIGQWWTSSMWPLLPDGAQVAPAEPSGPANRLAYIDATHLEPYSVHPWEYDAIDGLALNLARNGYLPLQLFDFTAARLERAGLLVSVAPSREFSARERQRVQQFVQRGGVLISMVGSEEAAASESLLRGFGLHVPVSPVPTSSDAWEPEPFGRTRSDYLEVEVAEGDRYKAAVRLYAAWPVESLSGDAQVYAYGRNRLSVVESDTELPVILARAVGRGEVVLIGDTCFALNKNLEYVGGEPFYGGYDNAHFWRWLLTRVQGQPDWIPPRPPPRKADGPDEETDATEQANGEGEDA